MADLKFIEKQIFEKLFDNGGYVLNFSNRTFEEFFQDFKVDIYLEKYRINGESKMNRLRTFWTIENNKLVGEVLESLLELANNIGEVELKDYQQAQLYINKLQDKKIIEKSTKKELKGKCKVFIVHGHDNEIKQEVARFIESLKLEAIILHEQANNGMTIIEKIEHYSNEANFAIILYTPCDKGRGAKEDNRQVKYRARQNVVLEHGYLMAKIGRHNVSALVKGKLETPSDISGVVYTEFDIHGAWKNQLVKELRSCKYEI